MAFFKHTENWFKGEAFEAWMLIIYGAMLVVLAFYFWRVGHTQAAGVLVIPFLVVGLLVSIPPSIGLYQNKSRLEIFRADHNKDPVGFVESEKERVGGFMKWYRPLLVGWSVLILIGLALFHLWGGNLGRAVGLAVILLAVGGLLVDNTSEQNARAYSAEIDNALK